MCDGRRLLALRDKFDLAFANDPDYDRHGIVTPAGLMNPNHYLAVADQLPVPASSAVGQRGGGGVKRWSPPR